LNGPKTLHECTGGGRSTLNSSSSSSITGIPLNFFFGFGFGAGVVPLVVCPNDSVLLSILNLEASFGP